MNIFESTYKNIIAEAANENTDCHEIMTACLCTMTLEKINEIISKISKDFNSINSVIDELTEISKSSKIIGASSDEIDSMKTFKDNDLALIQAISAARKILQINKNISVNKVILTGKKTSEEIQRYFGIANLKKNFEIDSYGMKDFNSSDIVLVATTSSKKPLYFGISLKKKKIGSEDPTLINRSLLDSLPENSKKIIDDGLNAFYDEILSKNYNLLIGDENVIPILLSKRKSILEQRNKHPGYLSENDFKNEETLKSAIEEKCKDANTAENKQIWKAILSESIGLMVTHENRDHIRKIINPLLASNKSPFRTIENIFNNEGVSAEIALQLLEIIFKGQLYALKYSNFEFALCTGTGKIGKKKGIEIGNGEYESITNVVTELSELKKKGQPFLKAIPNMNENNKNAKEKQFILFEDDESTSKTTISIFFKLMIAEESLAIIRIRYKGSYTSSPQIFAQIDPIFKKKIEDPIIVDDEDNDYDSIKNEGDYQAEYDYDDEESDVQ